MPMSFSKLSHEELCDYFCNKFKGNIKNFDEDDFKRWFMARKGLDLNFSSTLVWKAYLICKEQKQDYDHFIVIAAKEGGGKSTLAINLACWIDPDFALNKICFLPTQYLDNLETGKSGDCFELDEGSSILLSEESTTFTGRSTTKVLMGVRYKNYCHVICIQNFHLLQRYIRYHRIDTLIQITSRDKEKGKGFFTIYWGDAISRICKYGERFLKVTGVMVPNGTFAQGYWYDKFPNTIDKKEYIKLKDLYVKDLIRESKKEILNVKFVPAFRVARMIGISQKTIWNMIHRGEVEAKQFGTIWYITRESFEDMLKINNKQGKQGFEGAPEANIIQKYNKEDNNKAAAADSEVNDGAETATSA